MLRFPKLVLAAFGCLSGYGASAAAVPSPRATSMPQRQRIGYSVIGVALTIIENLILHDTNLSEPGTLLGPFVPFLLGHFCRRIAACFTDTDFRIMVRREMSLLSRVCTYAFNENAFGGNQTACADVCAYLLTSLLGYLREELRCRKLSSFFARPVASLRKGHKNATLRHNILFTVCFLVPLLPFQNIARVSTRQQLSTILPMTFFAKLLAPSSRQGRQLGICRREPRTKLVAIYAALACRPEPHFRAFSPIVRILGDMNAWSSKHVDEYDFNRRLTAYEALDTRRSYRSIVYGVHGGQNVLFSNAGGSSGCSRSKTERNESGKGGGPPQLPECGPAGPLLCQFLFDVHDSEFVIREAALHALSQVKWRFAAPHFLPCTRAPCTFVLH